MIDRVRSAGSVSTRLVCEIWKTESVEATRSPNHWLFTPISNCLPSENGTGPPEASVPTCGVSEVE